MNNAISARRERPQFKKRRPQRFKIPRIKLPSSSGLYIKILVFAIIFGIGFFLYQSVKIQGYVVYGNNRINIPSELEQIKGDSLFSNIEARFFQILDQDSDKVENVNIVKKIGGQVIIELIEKSPRIAYLGMDGIELLDENGVNVGSLNNQKFIELANYNFFNSSIQNIDDDRVVRRYLDVNADVEGAKLWADLTTEERQAFITQQKDYYIGLWNNFITTQKEFFNTSNYRDLNIVVNRVLNSQNTIKLDAQLIQYVINLKTFLSRYNIDVSEIRYKDILSFSFLTTTGKELIFRKNKDFQILEGELGTFLSKVGINNGSTFDFRGEIISVK